MQGKALVALLCVMYGGAFLGGFNENLVNMALVSVMGEFAVDSVTAQWLVTGYMIVATVGVTCVAFFYRRVKLRTLFFAASAANLIGSAMGLFATSFEVLLVARLIQAVGTGIFIPMMMNTVLAVTPTEKLGIYMAIGSCIISCSPAFSPVICGAIVTAFGWRYIFLVPIAVSVVLVVAGAAFVRNLHNSEAHLDIPSVALSAAALTCLSFGLAQLAITPVPAAVSLGAAVAGAVAFTIRQLHCEHPLIDLTPVRRPEFWPTLLLVTVTMMSTFSMSVVLPMYLEGALGLTAAAAGMVILVPVLVNVLVTLVGGRMLDKRGEWPLLPVGFGIIAIGFAFTAAVAPAMSVVAAFAGAVLVYGGVGLVFSPSQTAGLRQLPAEEHPFGVALSTTAVQVAACIGPSLFTGVMQACQASQVAVGVAQGLAAAQGFSAAMAIAACIGAAGFAVATVYALKARRRAKA